MTRKSLNTGCVVAACLMTVLSLLNLPVEYVESGGGRYGNQIPIRNAIKPDLPVMAGWPLQYSVRYDSDGVDENQNPIYRYWSPLHLAGNAVFGVLASGLMFLLIRYRELRIDQASDPLKIRRYFDTGFACVILLLPVALLASIYFEGRRQQQIINQFGRSRIFASTSNWIPRWVDKQIPVGLRSIFSRVRFVQVKQATDDELSKLAEINTLVDLELFNADVSPEAISLFRDHSHLVGLRMDSMNLNDGLLASVAPMPWLRRLSFSRSNVTESAFRQLDNSDRLEQLDLRYCSLPLASLGNPRWASTIEYLYASRPGNSREDSIKIHGWKKLKLVSIRRPFARSNAKILAIDFEDLPNLDTLLLDRRQAHDLRLVNLPKLHRVDDGIPPRLRVLGRAVWLKGYTWVRNVELDQVPTLKQLALHAGDLNELKLGQIPSLRSLKLSTQLESSQGGYRLERTEHPLCQSWIDQIGATKGPRSLELHGLSLASVDITPLTKNKKIRSLNFSMCQENTEKLKQLQGMSWLESLLVNECKFSKDEFSWFAKHFPKLSNFQFDGEMLEELKLTKDQGLVHLSSGPMCSVNHFRLINQVDLKTDFRLCKTPQTLVIKNAPRLIGLVFEEPLKDSSIIEGFRDLKWFAAAGSGIDDRVVDHVTRCTTLEQLTLAYHNASEESLHSIGRLNHLTALVVPGAKIDDDVTAHWKNITGLWEANLDDNPVGPRTIAWLSRNSSLRYLSLERLSTSGEGLDAINELRQITHLSLAESPIQTKNIQKLLEADTLEHLNLAGCEIDEKLLGLLSGSQGLKKLVLQRGQISDNQISQLKSANKSLVIEQVDLLPFTWPIDQKKNEKRAFASAGGDHTENASTEVEELEPPPLPVAKSSDETRQPPKSRNNYYRSLGGSQISRVRLKEDRGRLDLAVVRNQLLLQSLEAEIATE